MTNVWCVRAEFGTYAKQFVENGYVAIGWISNSDLSRIKARDELYPLYKAEHPGDTSNIVIGQQVGQIARFLLEIQAGDYVITPAADTEWLHYGKLAPDPSYLYAEGNDGCPYRHRRRVAWAERRLKRGDFSVPFQNTIRSSLTVFGISQRDEFLSVIGETRWRRSQQHSMTRIELYWSRFSSSMTRSSKFWSAISSQRSDSKAPRSRERSGMAGWMQPASSTSQTWRR